MPRLWDLYTVLNLSTTQQLKVSQEAGLYNTLKLVWAQYDIDFWGHHHERSLLSCLFTFSSVMVNLSGEEARRVEPTACAINTAFLEQYAPATHGYL